MIRVLRPALSACLAAGLLLGTAAVAAQAQQQPAKSPMPNLMRGTPQEEAACAPDSKRFCQNFEPDALQVLGCLQRNRERITAKCQRVLRARGV